MNESDEIAPAPTEMSDVIDTMRRLAGLMRPSIFHDEEDGHVELRWITGDQVVNVTFTLHNAYQFDRSTDRMAWEYKP